MMPVTNENGFPQDDHTVAWHYRLEITKIIFDSLIKIVTAIGATLGPIVMVWMQMTSNAKIDTATEKIDTVAIKADRNAEIAKEAVDKAAAKAAEKAVDEIRGDGP